MPSRARRRPNLHGPSLSFVLAFLLLLFLPNALAANAVLGLDLGTEYIKAALVKPGIPLEIVLTKDSKRKETSAVAFKPVRPGSAAAEQDDVEFPERLYGSDALGLASRFPTDVFPHLKHLLGASSPGKESAIQSFKQRYPGLDISDNENNGTITFKSHSFGSDTVHNSFSVEELLGMMLKGIRGNAESMAASLVRDVVITVPNFYTADERRAVVFAAELAGFKVIQLISDGLAVGLNYATTRTFPVPDDKNKPEYHLVFDMGAGSTTATLLRMQGKKIRGSTRSSKPVQEVTVLGVGWDRTLGGDALNDLIVQDMARKFVETSGAKAAGIDLDKVLQHGKTMAKFWREAERVRQVLSANTATSGFFEDLFEGVDFRYKLSRSDFEDMASPFAARLSQPVDDALAGANMAMEDLTSVILHGGLIRTPFIQSGLETRVGDAAKLRGNVNADEAAVFGAAFRAAGASPSFKVKEIKINEIAAYTHAVHWKVNEKPRTQQVFTPTSQVGPSKQMPLKLLDDFDMSISQKIPVEDTGSSVDRPVVQISTSNLTSSVNELVSAHNCARENISTTFYVRLDPFNNLPDISRGTVSCIGTAVEKKGGMMDGVKGIFGFGKKDQKPMSGDDDDDFEELEPLPELSEASTSSSSASKSSSKSKSKSTTSSVASVPTGKLMTIPVAMNRKKIGRPLPPESELRRIRDSLAAFDKSDQGRRIREELFNGLESFTYKVRDMLTESSFTGASSAEQRTEIETLLAATSDWLHSEGTTARIQPIKEKLAALKKLVDPVNKRKDESTKRPGAIKKLEDLLGTTEGLISKVQKAADKAAAEVSSASSILYASIAAESEAAKETESSTTTVPDADAEPSETAGSDEEDSASSTTSSEAPKYTFDSSVLEALNKFNQADVDRLQTARDTASKWLSEKIAEQKKLGPEEDPVLTIEELESAFEKLKKAKTEINNKEDRIKNAEKEKQRAKEKAEAKRKREEEKARKAKEKAELEAAAAESSAAEPGDVTNADGAAATDSGGPEATVLNTDDSNAEGAAEETAETKSHDEL